MEVKGIGSGIGGHIVIGFGSGIVRPDCLLMGMC